MLKNRDILNDCVGLYVYATIENKKFLYLDDTQDGTQDDPQDGTQDDPQDKILEYCKIPRSKNEITAFLGYKDAKSIAKNHLRPLIRTIYE